MENRPSRPKPGQRGSLGRAMRYLTRYRRQAAMPYIFLIVATLAQLAVPKMVGRIIDSITQGTLATTLLDVLNQIPAAFIPQALPRLLESLQYPADMTQEQLTARLTADQLNAPSALLTAVIAIIIFAVFRGLFAFLLSYWAERNSQGIAFDLRNDLFSKVQKLSFSYHDRNQTGQLMIRATDDVEKVRLFIGQGLLQLVGAVVLLTGTLIILLTTNVRLTLAVLPVLPLSLLVFVIFGIISGPLFAKVQVKLSSLNIRLQESLAGVKVIKAFAREVDEIRRFQRSADDLMKQQITVSRTLTFLFPLVFLIANLGQAATLYYGGRQIIDNTLTIGQWQEFSLYLVYVFLPLAQFGFIVTQLGQASASSNRIFEILDARNDVVDQPDAQALPAIDGQVVFENVTFRYFSSGAPVLSEVSFEARPGQTIALLGATGSGKTTIINLIPRFYDPSQGRILIDGHDLRQVTLESLRSQIGIVLQETTLFSGTIRDNIAFGKPDASLEQVIAAAQAAEAHDFILSFKEGYDTLVGERGATLSGGQKQRIAIARALLLNPRILILDDSTSSVDLATEARIQKALDRLMLNRTSFVIAQRISTVRHADQILVLEQGRIVARGTHTELMEDSPLYAEIYNSQLVGDAEESQE